MTSTIRRRLPMRCVTVLALSMAGLTGCAAVQTFDGETACDGTVVLPHIVSTTMDSLESGRAFAPEFYDARSMRRKFCAGRVDILQGASRGEQYRLAVLYDLASQLPPSSIDVRALDSAEFRIHTSYDLAGSPTSAGSILVLRAGSNSLDLRALRIATGGRLVRQPFQPGRGTHPPPPKPHGNETWELQPKPGPFQLKGVFELQPDGTLETASFFVENRQLFPGQ